MGIKRVTGIDSGNGLEFIAPVVIRFPIEQAIKSIVNLKLGRKKLSSFMKLLAVVGGLILGYNFPHIGNSMAFFITLASVTPLTPAAAATITIGASMVLTASVLVYLTRLTFRYYNTSRYGVSNSELRLTENDKKLLRVKYTELEDKEIAVLFKRTEYKILFLVHEINRYKVTKQVQAHQSAKFVLNSLKRGEFVAFELYCEEELNKSLSRNSIRKKKLEKLLTAHYRFYEKINGETAQGGSFIDRSVLSKDDSDNDSASGYESEDEAEESADSFKPSTRYYELQKAKKDKTAKSKNKASHEDEETEYSYIDDEGSEIKLNLFD